MSCRAVPPQVRSICEEMTMDGCERCMPSWQAGKTWADCDLLDTYSYLCYQMPGGWLGWGGGVLIIM
jgi:copper transporter 1